MTLIHSRRDFLRHVLIWAASSSVISCGLLATRAKTPDELSLDWLHDSIANFESASRIGNLYLASHPDENNVDLFDKVDKILQAHNTAKTLGAHSFENIDSVVRADYMQGDMVFVDSWIISRTEARLYALIFLGDKTSQS